MPVDPPDPAAIRAVAQRYGLGLSDADVTSFGPFVEGLLASWDARGSRLRACGRRIPGPAGSIPRDERHRRRHLDDPLNVGVQAPTPGACGQNLDPRRCRIGPVGAGW